SDGSVVAWGANYAGQTDVPPGLTNAIAVAARSDRSAALRSDGTLVMWGRNLVGESDIPPTLTNVQHIALGYTHSLALVGDSAPVISLQPRGRTVLAGTAVTLACTIAGTTPLTFRWQRNNADIPDATNAFLRLIKVSAIDAASYQLIATNRLGRATSRV